MIRVCQDGMQFRVFGGLQLPEYGFVRPPRALPPPYLVHLVVADGVPTRAGAALGAGPDAWTAGINPREAIVQQKARAHASAALGPSATAVELAAAAGGIAGKLRGEARHALKKVLPDQEVWLEYGVEWDKNTMPLNRPDAADILLEQQFSVPSAWLLDVQFPQETEPNPAGFLSEPYPKPGQNRQALWGRRVGVSQYGEYTLGWTRAKEPEIDALLSISFEGFAKGRRSADFIAKVTPGRLFRGPDL
jgi:hypothetical protein